MPLPKTTSKQILLLTNCAGNISALTQKAFRTLLYIIAAFLLLSACISNAYSQPDAVKEYDLKATFLYKLINFIEWPEAAFNDSEANFNLCILGDDPFGNMLERYRGKKVFGRMLVIHKTRELSDKIKYHALFIKISEREKQLSILKTVKDFPVLTVGDTEGFCQRGGIINLTLKEDKIRFEINVEAADQAGLKVRSKLLRLSTIVETEN
ncbi:MAG: YfiR family protein [Deltaproteobacteria bacterium]|nr:YfiR family protein [Deltaproteobacteria bacterium]